MTAARATPWAARGAIDDPIAFQKHWLGRRLWEKQKEIPRALLRYPLVAVKGCHASGKTHVASGIPIQHIVANRKSKALVTAPTIRQVKTFFEEISTARRGGLIASLIPEPSTTRLEIDPDRYAIGASSSRGVNMQGLHSPRLIVIADEAPGIGQEIWDALEGARAGGDVHVLELGNPVVPSGHFYDAFGRHRAIYHTISISAFDTPNMQHETEPRPLSLEELMELDDERLAYSPYPYLITRRWVRERYIVWGQNHPQWHSRVLADFPSEDPYACFPLLWVERAKRDPTDQEALWASRCAIQVGIDVAGAGDDETAATARAGGVILETQAWTDADPRGAVLAWLKGLRTKFPAHRLGMIVVDTVGIGYNFALHIADNGFQVYGFNAGQRAIDPNQFENQKAEAHFTLRDYMRENSVSQLVDPETIAQLSTIRYRENSRGRVEIESKEQRNQRGIPGSPDRAESLIMAFMRVVPREQSEVINAAGEYRISAV